MTLFMKRIIAVILLSIATVSILSVNLVEGSVKKQLQETQFKFLELSAANQADAFDRDLKQVEMTSHELRTLVESHFDMRAFKEHPQYMSDLMAQLKAPLERIATDRALNHSAYIYFLPEMTGTPMNLWYADLDKNGSVELQPSLPLSYFDGDLAVKAWYYGPLAAKHGYWTQPYMGSAPVDRDVVYFSYTEPVIVDGQVIAVVGNDFYFNNIKEKVLGFNLEGKGYATLIDATGMVLVHPDLKTGVDLKTYQNNKYRSLVDHIIQSGKGTYQYTWENETPKVMVYQRLINGWTFVATMTQAEMYQSVFKYNQTKWLVLIVGLILTFILLYVIVRRAIEPMVGIRDFLDHLSKGEYQFEASPASLSKKDEFAAILRKLEILRIELKRQSEHFLLDQTQLEQLLAEKHEALLKTNEYLELSLTQIQERNSELSLVHERYDDQLKRNNLLSERLYVSEQMASLAYILTGLAYDLNSPIGNTKTMTSFLQNESAQLARKLLDGSLKKQDFEDFIKNLNESLALMEKGMDSASAQLQQFKRISGGQTLHQSTVFNVKTELTKLFHHTADQVVNQQLRLTLNMNDLIIKSDMGAFIQLFNNLFKFSVNYSYLLSNKGMIHIRAERINQNSIQVIYEDFDRKLPEEALRKALVPHLTSSLGNEPQLVLLNICYHIVTKMFSGTFTHEMVSENGHKFYMLLKVDHID